jgi:hypothetical protein
MRMFVGSFVSFSLLLGLTVYYGEKCPTVPGATSGAIYPLFDKFHSDYVYLTETGAL